MAGFFLSFAEIAAAELLLASIYASVDVGFATSDFTVVCMRRINSRSSSTAAILFPQFSVELYYIDISEYISPIVIPTISRFTLNNGSMETYFVLRR